MTTLATHQWSRSNYPGQPSTQSSTPSSPTTISQSTEGSIPHLNPLLEKATVPWYRAVTQDPSEDRKNALPDLDSTKSPNGKEPFAYGSPPLRQISCFTPPVEMREDPLEQDDQMTIHSPDLPHNDLSTRSTTSWLADDDHSHSTEESSPVYSPSQPSTQGSYQPSTGQTSPERTLRRSLRSQRITSAVNEEPSTRRINGDSISPVEDTPSHLPPPPYQKESEQPPPNSGHPTMKVQHHGNVTSDGQTWNQRDVLSSHTSTDIHSSAPQSDAGEERSEQSSSPSLAPIDQHPKEVQVTKVGKLYRRGYPLQSPASRADLRGPPTPSPSTSGNELAPVGKDDEQPHTRKQQLDSTNKSARRLPYPLQSNPSIHANINTSANQPPSPLSEESDDTMSESGEMQAYEPPHPALNGSTFRRAAYPLQAQAVATTSKSSPPSQQKPELIKRKAPEQDRGNFNQSATESVARAKADVPQDAPTGKSAEVAVDAVPPIIYAFRRKGYPLQELTGTSIAQSTQSPKETSNENSRTSAGKDAAKSSQKASGESQKEGQNTSKGSAPTTGTTASSAKTSNSTQSGKADDKSWQTRAQNAHNDDPCNPGDGTAPGKQNQPSKAPTETPRVHIKLPKDNEKADLVDRERALASKVLKQWRRPTYPANSPDGLTPFERAPTPQPPLAEDDTKVYGKPKPVHLPKNISAQRDSEDKDVKGRTIVVCLDGTGDKFDDDNSNIVHIVSSLKKDDPHQVTYYQAGIGTYGDNGLSSGFAAAADMAVGSGLGLHVRDAYHFLMHTYKEGDKICIFGFSRGAYTARCLAGMIHKVGLLPPRNIQQIYFAYQFYTADDEEGWKKSEDFKKTFSIDVNVYFLGCFDSVASVGFIPRQLPLSTTPNNKPIYFRHAMALDERRAKFKVCRYQIKKWDDILRSGSRKNSVVPTITGHAKDILPNYKEQADVPPGYHRPKRYGTNYHPNVTDEEYEDLKGHDVPFDTDVSEVWFAGAHADIGGGAVGNSERHKLAQIPLRWMIRQAFECNTGIIFKTKMLAEFGLDIHTLWPKYEQLKAPTHDPPPSLLEKYQSALPPRHIRRDKLIPINKHENGEPFYELASHHDDDWTPELLEDYYDALSPLNDQLIQAPTWWILEFMPVQYKVPLRPGEVELRTGMNWGRYRGVEDIEPRMHWTVKHRVKSMDYQVRVRTAKNIEWKVVV